MGPEHPAVPVGGGPGQRGAQEDHVPGVEERPREGHGGRDPSPVGCVRHRRGEGGARRPPPRLRLTRPSGGELETPRRDRSPTIAGPWPARTPSTSPPPSTT